MQISCLSFLIAGCLACGAVSAAESVRASAAAYTRTVATDLEFDDGSSGELTTRRYGVEYWEVIQGNIHAGFVIGYSESELRAGGLLQEVASGSYGGLGFRFRQPLTAQLDLTSNIDAVYQKDSRSIDDTRYRFRTIENSAELGLRYRAGPLFFGAGGAWRRVDFLQKEEEAAGLASGEAKESSGTFAEIGLFADRGGSIMFRWDDGVSQGWALRYERDF